jgi:hypothetical protein
MLIVNVFEQRISHIIIKYLKNDTENETASLITILKSVKRPLMPRLK